MTTHNITDDTKWVILGDDMTDTGLWLYWSNDNGWVPVEQATIFTTADVQDLNLPQGALGWSLLQG